MDPNFIKVKVEAAKRYKINKKFKDAEKELLDALEIQPKNLYLKTTLADIFYQEDRLSDADVMISEVLSVQPDNLFANYLAGLIAYKKNRLEKSLEYFLTTLKFKPDHFAAQKMVITIQIKQNCWDQALNRTTSALETHPDDPFLMGQLARIYRAKKQYNNALDILENLKQQKKDNQFIRKQIIELKAIIAGKGLSEIKKEVDSMLSFQSQQDRPELWQLHAENLCKLKDWRGAVEAYQHLLKLCPNNDFFRKQQAFLYKKMGASEKAIEHMTPLFLKDPADIYLRNSLSTLYQNQYGLWAWIQLLEEANRKHPEVTSLLGLIKKYQQNLDALENLKLTVYDLEKNLQNIAFLDAGEVNHPLKLREVQKIFIKFVLLKGDIPTFETFNEHIFLERETHRRISRKLDYKEIRWIYQQGIFWIHFYLNSRELPGLKAVTYRIYQTDELIPVVWVRKDTEIFFKRIKSTSKKLQDCVKYKTGLLLRIPNDFNWSNKTGDWQLSSQQDLNILLKRIPV
jgi:predicted Zn-dependent protease